MPSKVKSFESTPLDGTNPIKRRVFFVYLLLEMQEVPIKRLMLVWWEETHHYFNNFKLSLIFFGSYYQFIGPIITINWIKLGVGLFKLFRSILSGGVFMNSFKTLGSGNGAPHVRARLRSDSSRFNSAAFVLKSRQRRFVHRCILNVKSVT